MNFSYTTSINCPFCEIDFEVSDLDMNGYDYFTAEVECTHCNQEVSISVEIEIKVYVTEVKHGEEYEEKREIANDLKSEFFMIYLETVGLKVRYYTDLSLNGTFSYKKAKLFTDEENAKIYMKSIKNKYPDIKIIKYKHCSVIEDDIKNVGLFG